MDGWAEQFFCAGESKVIAIFRGPNSALADIADTSSISFADNSFHSLQDYLIPNNRCHPVSCRSCPGEVIIFSIQ